MNQEDQTRLLYQQEQFPIFQNRMYDSEAEAKACPKGDVQLVEDQRTGLVYNAAFRPELMAYDFNYQNEQAVSLLFQEYLESVSSIIDRCMGRDSIVEVGCGKGFFLEMLLGKGFDVTGFDPTYEGNNPKILKHYFEPGVGIKANGLVLRHVLEHVPRIQTIGFLKSLRAGLAIDGKAIIQVPNLQSPFGYLHHFNDFTHVSGFVEHSLAQVLLAAGFQEMKFYGFEEIYKTGAKQRAQKIIRWCYHKSIRFLRALNTNPNPAILTPVLYVIAW